MKLAKLQVDEMAAPVLALVRDGAFYDVATLEERWATADISPDACSFHTRVVAARCAGLTKLDARLSSGQRPTEARLRESELLLLPPCASSRISYLQLQPLAAPTPLRVERRDARSLVGDAQPLLFPAAAAAPRFEVGLAVLIGEELHRASEKQVRRSLVGVTALIDWTSRRDWRTPRWEPHPPSQLGPLLLVGASMHAALRSPLRLNIGSRTLACEPAVDIAARIAALTQLLPLAPGDVVGVGCMPGAAAEVSFGDVVSVTLRGAPPLRGWALPHR